MLPSTPEGRPVRPLSATPASDLVPSNPAADEAPYTLPSENERDSFGIQSSLDHQWKRQHANSTTVALGTGKASISATNATSNSTAPSTSPFVPTHTQYITIYVIEFYVVTLLLCWNLKYARTAIFSFKLLTVAFHESCHAIMGTLTGAKVESIMLDPNQGGATRMRGGFAFVSKDTRVKSSWSACAQLPAGYIGSTTIGATLIFCGFDEYASKIACFPVLALILLVAFWARKDWFTLVNLLVPLGFIVLLYVIEHAAYLRFLILFIGVMNVMVRSRNLAGTVLRLTFLPQYACWDILDDLVFQKIEESDCCHFARLYPWMPAQAWGAVWFTFAFTALAAGVLGGLVFFKANFEEQQLKGATFIPT